MTEPSAKRQTSAARVAAWNGTRKCAKLAAAAKQATADIKEALQGLKR